MKHHKNCQRPACCCGTLFSSITNHAELSKADWYRLLKDVLEAQAEAFASSRLHLLLGHVYLGCLQNKYKSIYHLNRAELLPMGLSLALHSHSLRELIQQYINSENMHNGGFSSLYDFHQGLTHFRRDILASCAQHLLFWKELQEARPYGIKLY